MAEPLYRRDLVSDIRGIRQVADQAWVAARTRPGLRTITGVLRVLAGGSLTAVNADNVSVVEVGAATRNDGTPVTGLVVRRVGGQEALVAAYGATGAFTLASLDEAQNVVVSAAGDGLDRPYLPVLFRRAPTSAWVSVVNSSNTAEFTTEFYRQHTHLRLVVGYSVDASTTLSVDAFDEDNALVIQADTVAGVASGQLDWTVPISGSHMDPRKVSVRAGKTGSGNALIQVITSYSMPAPS